MPLTLPRLPWSVAIVEESRRPTLQMQSWWDVTGRAIENAFATGEANDVAITATQADLATAVADLAAAVADIEVLGGQVAGAQPASSILFALSGLVGGTGLLEQTGETSFAHREVGIDDDGKIPTKGLGDTRWVIQDGDAFPALPAYAGYAGTAIGNPPTQGEVQAVDAALVTQATAIADIITCITALKTALDTANVLT
jgi:hypothetical protein